MLLLNNHRDRVNARRAEVAEVNANLESELELCDELPEITDAEIAAWDAERDAIIDSLNFDTEDDLTEDDTVPAVDPLSVVGSPERMAALAKIAARIEKEIDDETE